MSSIASLAKRRTRPVLPGRASLAAAGPDVLPGLAQEHARMLQRVGVLTQARLAAANITLLVARVWDDYESEPAGGLAPSALSISAWVQRARSLDEPNPH